jgi:hypothetical protein
MNILQTWLYIWKTSTAQQVSVANLIPMNSISLNLYAPNCAWTLLDMLVIRISVSTPATTQFQFCQLLIWTFFTKTSVLQSICTKFGMNIHGHPTHTATSFKNKPSIPTAGVANILQFSFSQLIPHVWTYSRQTVHERYATCKYTNIGLKRAQPPHF